ncbi:MAG: 2,3,4,5-tetrahydropyridine-2,6-dicarboxylate N-acetyltransferase [Firmicutes bacterium]|nr:2,3,4,5-tetrahydropyridine-2,6-dicarboxylate N-acetyltransferase [Bacillota bacterium]
MEKNIYDLTDAYEIARYIKESEKQTTAKAYVSGDLSSVELKNGKKFGTGDFWVLIGDADEIKNSISNNDKVKDFVLENNMRNSAIPMMDITEVPARIEPGAVIRNGVTIDKSAVVMMGAVINIGAVIGEGTMIDMNAVLGARATIGKNCHIGAGAVIAGVLEPPSATPVIIEDNVLVGANAVVLEGCRIGKNSVVAAGSVVTEDVPADSVVAGSPAVVIKAKDEKTESKTQLLDDLRD